LATNVRQTAFTPQTGALSAVRHHWFVAAFPVALFVAAALVLGLHRTPRYTTSANVSLGHVYVSNAASIPTIIDATQSLASTFSRAVYSNAVASDTRRILRNEHSVGVTGSLSATPIPESPLISVSAESSSARAAVALANAGAEALTAYINHQVRDNDASATLAKRYLKASLDYRHRLDTSNRLAQRYANHPTSSNRDARDRASGATDAARLRRDAVTAAYATAVQGGAAGVGAEVFSSASGATSDRSHKLQLMVFVGLAGGLAAGAALALLRASRDIRRRSQ
jgi:uncharacterized protein involved in exopolysaccharide biosynthesis